MSLEHFLKTFRWFTVGMLKIYIEKAGQCMAITLMFWNKKNDRVQTDC